MLKPTATAKAIRATCFIAPVYAPGAWHWPPPAGESGRDRCPNTASAVRRARADECRGCDIHQYGAIHSSKYARVISATMACHDS